MLTAVALKQELQDGTDEVRLRWESPKVQRTVSGGKVERIRIRIKQDSKINEDVSMVALSRGWSNLVSSGLALEGVKRERANPTKL